MMVWQPKTKKKKGETAKYTSYHKAERTRREEVKRKNGKDPAKKERGKKDCKKERA
jgi:hypothetical protein